MTWKKAWAVVMLAALVTACGKSGAPVDEEAAAEKRREAAKAEEKAEEAKPLAQQRGLQNFEGGNTRTVVIVKAPLAEVAGAILKNNPTREEIEELKGEITLKTKAYFVMQLKGHDWTAVANLTKGAQTPEKLAGALAKALSTKAVYYEYSSFSGSTHYRMYDGAEEVEYLDVMDPDDAKLVLEHSKEMTAEGRKVFEGIREGDGVRFKSAKRKLTGDEKKDGDIFVNRAMKEEDALIPDLAGSFLGEAGKKMDFGDVPFGKEDVVGMVVVQGDNAPK